MSEFWDKVSKVPVNYLKPIGFGNLKGKSDINPQWRLKVMSETYGMCGTGWYHSLQERWTTNCDNGELLCFCEVHVFVKHPKNDWSHPIVGIGGNKLIVKNKNGLIPNDEGWKMAYTDALGTALKSLGVASEIYEGNFDGSKYLGDGGGAQPQQQQPQRQQAQNTKGEDDKPWLNDIGELIKWAKDNGKSAQEAIGAARVKFRVSKSKATEIEGTI